jgi:beta-N-acetylhexosaminidase
MIHLSTAACAGQVIVAGFGPGEPPESLCELAAAGALGGFILFRRNIGSPSEVAELNARLRALAPDGLPLWIAVDQEGGRVARLRSPVVTLPAMRVLGELDDVRLTRDAAYTLGRQLALLGFNLDFAPVLDVDTNPANPVIGDRSFAREPERVATHARAFAAGLAAAGIVACGKHFPGHGDTTLDSHLELPRVSHARERLECVELSPFKALHAQLPCIMTAHVVFDALDPGVPATLSRRIVSDVLRGELGFTGLVWSDDLEMKAISERWGVPDAACAAIEAGCDAVLICSQPELVLAAQRAIADKAQRDPQFEARLREAAQRSIACRPQRAPLAAAMRDIDRALKDERPELIEARIAAAGQRAAPT